MYLLGLENHVSCESKLLSHANTPTYMQARAENKLHIGGTERRSGEESRYRQIYRPIVVVVYRTE